MLCTEAATDLLLHFQHPQVMLHFVVGTMKGRARSDGGMRLFYCPGYILHCEHRARSLPIPSPKPLNPEAVFALHLIGFSLFLWHRAPQRLS